jgi:hypothetical protein
MDRQQVVERAIYIPKGRRELSNGSEGNQKPVPVNAGRSTTPVTQATDVSFGKRPTRDNNELVENAPVCSKPTLATDWEGVFRTSTVSTDDNQRNTSREESDQDKFRAEQEAIRGGIYVPKGRREALEAKKVENMPAKGKARSTADNISSATGCTPKDATQDSNEVASSIETLVLNHHSRGGDNGTEKLTTTATMSTNGSSSTSGTEAATSSKLSNTSRGAGSVGGVYVPPGRRNRELTADSVNTAGSGALGQSINSNNSDGISPAESAASNTGNSKRLGSNGEATGDDATWEYEVVEDEEYYSGPGFRPKGSTGNSSTASLGLMATDNNSSSSSAANTVQYMPDDVICSCCLLISGIRSDASDIAKGNIARQYAEKGATVRWVSPTECVVAFKTEKSVVLCAGLASVYKTQKLREVAPATFKDEIIAGTYNNEYIGFLTVCCVLCIVFCVLFLQLPLPLPLHQIHVTNTDSLFCH